MRKLLFLLSISLLSLTGFAQKPIIGVENFSGSGTEASLNTLRNNIMTSAYHTNRVEVVDLNDHNDGMRYNAFLRAQVNDAAFSPTEIIGNDLKRHHGKKCEIRFTLSIIDAQDGTIIKQENFYTYGTGRDEEDALMDAVQIGGDFQPVKSFILNAFPLGGSIVALGESDVKKAKTVYVDLGSQEGLTKGMKLEVYKEIDIAGEKSRKLIGELKVEEVMGPNRSLCKVTKNGDVILKELNNGSYLPIKSKSL